MSQNADIRLDFNNVMSEAIGDAGLSRADVDGLKAQTDQIHRGVQELRKLGQMPFLDLAHYTDDLRDLQNLASDFRSRFRKFLVLGIGGSALGPKWLVEALRRDRDSEIRVCDSLDALSWSEEAGRLGLEDTALVVISKSGRTLETWAAFLHFFEMIRASAGEKAWKRVAIITDSEKGALRALAEEKGVPCLKIAPGVGGRFSVLSPVGLFPAALAGADTEALLAGARRMEERCGTNDPWLNPALMSAMLHERYETLRRRNVRVLLSYTEASRGFGPWFAQLWAESLGKRPMDGKKEAVGSTPVFSSGPRDQHSQLQLYLDGPQDKVITLLGVEEGRGERLPEAPDWARVLGEDSNLLSGRRIHDLSRVSRLATEEALRARQRPNQTILMKDGGAYDLGQLIMMCELETVYAGQLLGVNPFDQPAVEQIKRNVREFLSGKITPSKSRNYMI